MTIYIVFFVAVILLWGYLLGNTASKKINTLCLVAAGVFLVAMMTLRYSIGYDYISYEGIFAAVQEKSFQQISTEYGYEQLFYLICKAVAVAGGSYRMLLLLCNIIMVSAVCWVIYRHSSLWWLSMMLYMALQFVPHSMNLLRQSLAASVLFLGWSFLKEGKFIKYALVVLLASAFHFSALVMLPAYFLMRLPYNGKVLAVYGGATLVGYLAFWPLLRFVVTTFVPRYAMYLDSSIFAMGNGLFLACVVLPYMIAAMMAAKMLIAKDKNNRVLIYSAIFTFLFFLFMSKMYIFERFSIYFFMYAMILLPEIVTALLPEPIPAKNAGIGVKSAYKKAKENYKVAVVLIVGCALAFFFLNFFMGAHKAYPYVSMWEPQRAVDNDTYFQEHLR